MKNRLLLIGAAALSLITTATPAATRSSPMTMRPAMTQPAPRVASRTMTDTHHFRHFHDRTFIFIDAFGFPVFYPYPYYGAYYGYDDFGYGEANIAVEVQQRLARAGYYHGPIDGIMGRKRDEQSARTSATTTGPPTAQSTSHFSEYCVSVNSLSG